MHRIKLPISGSLIIIAALVVVVAAVATTALTSASGTDIAGDVDCNGQVNPVDSLHLLRHDAGLQVNQPPGCPLIGSPIGAPTPVPTPTPPSGYTITFPGFYADPDTFEATVTSLMLMNTISGDQFDDDVVAPPGAHFAVVFMNVINFGSEPDFAGGFALRLTDSIGRSFSTDFDNSSRAQRNAEDQYQRLGTFDTLQPGIPADMVFVFQVPLDATGLTVSRCPADGSIC